MAENLPTLWEALGPILSTGSEENTHAHRKEKEIPKGIPILAFLTNWEMQRSLCLDSNMALLDRTTETGHTFLVCQTLQRTAFTESLWPQEQWRVEQPVQPGAGAGCRSWRCLGNSSVYSIAAHPESSVPALTFCSFAGLTGKEKWNHPRSLESRD